MGIVNGLSIVNNLIAGSMTGAQLQTYLATGANLASFVQVTNVRRQLQVLRNTPAAVTAVTASALASATIATNDAGVRQWLLYGTSYSWRSFANLAAVLASAAVMAEVASSGAAMAALASSPETVAALIASPTALSAVLASSTAMAAVIASPTALASFVASSTAMEAVAASSAAMGVVAASSTAMTAVGASSTAKMAVFGNDVALAAIAGSSVALAALRGAAGYAVGSAVSSTTAKAIPGAASGGSYILLGVSCGNAGSSQITALTTRRSGSTRPITVASAPSTGTDATVTTMCTPLVASFTFTSNNNSFTWYFGMLRCDV